MRFKVEATTSNRVFGTGDDTIKKYPCLNDFRLETEELRKPDYGYMKDVNGKVIKFDKGIRIERIPHVRIETIEDLMRFIDAVKYPIVINNSVSMVTNGLKPIDEAIIEIYDDYRE